MRAPRRFLLVALALLPLLACWSQQPEPKQEQVGDGILMHVLELDTIPAIDQPQFVSAKEAKAFMHPNEPVLGLFDGKVAKAYSALAPRPARNRQRLPARPGAGGGHLVTPGLHGCRVHPRGQRGGAHLWRLRQALQERPGHVRPPDQLPLDAGGRISPARRNEGRPAPARSGLCRPPGASGSGCTPTRWY